MRRHYPGLAASTVLAVLLVVLLRRRFTMVTVIGKSMLPTLAAGDRVLVRRAGVGQLRPGQVVVFEHPDKSGGWPRPQRCPVGRCQWMIKRVVAVPGDPRPDACLPTTADPPERRVPAGKFVVLGDNPVWSYDSRQIGYFPGERLLGIMVLQFPYSAGG